MGQERSNYGLAGLGKQLRALLSRSLESMNPDPTVLAQGLLMISSNTPQSISPNLPNLSKRL